MIHLDPDFKSLSENQRTVALKCLYGLTRHANEQRSSGLTQIHLIHAIGSTLLGVDLDVQDAAVDNDSLSKLTEEFKEISEPVRHRLFQLFTLAELVLDPLPVQATETLKHAAEALGVKAVSYTHLRAHETN